MLNKLIGSNWTLFGDALFLFGDGLIYNPSFIKLIVYLLSLMD